MRSAERLIRLVRHLSTSKRQFGCSPADLEPIWKLYSVRPSDELVQFLTLITPRRFVDIGVVKLMPPTDLLEYQTEYAPIYYHTELNLFGLTYWTGISDGDAWVIDLRNDTIFNLSIGSEYESREAAVENSQLVFRDFDRWVSYLYGECLSRTWTVPPEGD
jgi:hypothetical protein